MDQTRTTHSDAAGALADLLDVMARLRTPLSGCPWDLEQTFKTIAPYTIEEAYEVADAIDRGDLPALEDELGDLLFQVVFHARMAEEAGAFDFARVARAVTTKMLRRHPHVFSDRADQRTAEEQAKAWETIKASEHAQTDANSVLDGVPRAAPALMRAAKLAKRAARIGFDWPDAQSVFAKLDEERSELEQAIAAGDRDNVAEEIGDVLFVLANLARKLGVDPEDCLRAANAKFERRFRHVERRAAETATPLPLATLDAYWEEAKGLERRSPD
jgi:ATP diphosphatase